MQCLTSDLKFNENHHVNSMASKICVASVASSSSSSINDFKLPEEFDVQWTKSENKKWLKDVEKITQSYTRTMEQ